MVMLLVGGGITNVTIASTYDYIRPEGYSHLMTVKNFDNDKFKSKISEMFKIIGFEGIFSLEFLIGPMDELYFLEINFRNSTWSYASTVAGMPIPIMWASDTLNGKSQKILTIDPPFKAIVEFDDFRYRIKTKKVSLIQWLKELNKCKCKYYFVRNDISPFISVIISKIRRSVNHE